MKYKFFTNMPLVISILVTMSIASTEVPIWASAFSLVMVIWKFLAERHNIPKLSPKITPIFGLMFFAIVYIQHRTIFGQEESITILLGLTAITVLNFETERDLLFLVLLGFLMVVLKSVFSLDFIWVVPALVSYFGLWVTLISNKNVNKFKYLFMSILRSIPLLFLLFVLFPRLVLFQMNKNTAPIQQTGFSEELNPGRFSNVALSNETVFRVEFLNTDSINASDLYWRGAVLNNSNNFIWTKGSNERKPISFAKAKPNKNSIKYRVVLEPLNLKNIFVLETPVGVRSVSDPVQEWNQSLYTLSDQQQQMVQFEGDSTFDADYYNIDDTTDSSRYLKIAPLPPKTHDWIDKTKSKYAKPEDRYEALVTFFQKPGFIYTLNPGYYENNLDQFLFGQKKGFCEHYAAAFATMARGLNIPSRVVIGYQGGAYNALGNFWKISQKDAHAWVEVGLKNRWQRIDPTALVTPLRITLGGENYFSLNEEDRMLFAKDKNWRQQSSFKNYYNNIISLFENLNYNWTLFLLNYDLQAQLEIFKSIRGSWFFVLFVLLVPAYLYSNRNRKRLRKAQQKHQLYELFLKIENWARKNGVATEKSNTPIQILNKMANQFPKSQKLILEFERDYESVVYQEKEIKKRHPDWELEWKQFFNHNEKT